MKEEGIYGKQRMREWERGHKREDNERDVGKKRGKRNKTKHGKGRKRGKEKQQIKNDDTRQVSEKNEG